MDSSTGTSSFSPTVSEPSPMDPPKKRRMTVASRTRTGQCTHLTMTRIFTQEFLCGICQETGDLGWIWRCTQDRELYIEDDLETGRHEHLDNFSRTFPRQIKPRKFQPAARTTALSFLGEVTENQLKQYTTEQITRIMEQRLEVLRVAYESKKIDLMNTGYVEIGEPKFEPEKSVLAQFGVPPDPSDKPFLPDGPECQFKCCQKCRGSLRDRSWISLNAVADGEYPPTTFTGFGFNFEGRRKVVDAKFLLNIGLRRPPAPPKPQVASSYKRQRLNPVKGSPPSEVIGTVGIGPSPFNDDEDADTTFSQPPTANFYDSSAMVRSSDRERSRYSSNALTALESSQEIQDTVSRKSQEPVGDEKKRSPGCERFGYKPNAFTITRDTRAIQIKGTFQLSADDKKDAKYESPRLEEELSNHSPKLSNTPPLRHSVIDTPSRKRGFDKSGRRQTSKRSIPDEYIPHCHPKLDDPLEADIGLQHPKSPPSTPTHKKRHANPSVAMPSTSIFKQIHSHITFVDSEDQEMLVSRPSTTMEKKEEQDRSFSGEPLKVEDGVAVTEEAVALHVPDVITQF